MALDCAGAVIVGLLRVAFGLPSGLQVSAALFAVIVTVPQSVPSTCSDTIPSSLPSSHPSMSCRPFPLLDTKAHRNGLKRPTTYRFQSLKGVDPKWRRNMKFAKRGSRKAKDEAKDEK